MMIIKLKFIILILEIKIWSFNNESTVIYHPFLSLNSIINVEDINLDLLKNINLNQILNFKKFDKKNKYK